MWSWTAWERHLTIVNDSVDPRDAALEIRDQGLFHVQVEVVDQLKDPGGVVRSANKLTRFQFTALALRGQTACGGHRVLVSN